MIEKSLETGKNIVKENESLMWRMIWLIKINSNIDNHLNRVKNKIVDLRFVQPLSIPEILAELQIADDCYYRALSISKDDGFKLYLKRNPDSCFLNNYFNDWLKAKQADMDIQLILNEYKAVTICDPTFQNVKTVAHKSLRKHVKRLLRNICIIMKHWKQCLKHF